jgi:hypothetical protein
MEMSCKQTAKRYIYATVELFYCILKQIEWVRITKEISIWGGLQALALDMYLLYIWIALPSSNEILYILIPVSSGPVDVHCYKK